MPIDPAAVVSPGTFEGVSSRLSDLDRRVRVIESANYAVGLNAVGSAQLGPNSVNTQHIVANSITTAMLQAGLIIASHISANAITANAIQANAINATHIQSNTIGADQLQANSITAGQLAVGTITATQIAAGTITAQQIAANTITAGNIAAGSITAAELSANTITAGQIAANTITANELAANSVGAQQIIAGSITSSAIATGSITSASIAAGAIDGAVITGARIQTSSSSGVPRVILGTGITTTSGTYDGLVGVDASNALTFLIDTATGTAKFRGEVLSNSSGLGNIDGATPNAVLMVGGKLLTDNPNLDSTSISSYGFSNSSVARDTTNYFTPGAGLTVTSAASGSLSVYGTQTGGPLGGLVAVTPGLPYSFGVTAKSTVARTIYTYINWYNSSGTYLSQAVVSVPALVNQWKRYNIENVTAPAGAAYCLGVFNWIATGAGEVVYTDNWVLVQRTTASGGIIVADSITAAEIAAGTITSTQINVGQLFSTSITATGTITGAGLIGGYYKTSTNTSAARVEIDSSGFRAYPSGAGATAALNYNTTANTLSITGGTLTGSTFQTSSSVSAGLKLDTANGLRAWDGSNNLVTQLNTTGGLNLLVGSTGGTIPVNGIVWHRTSVTGPTTSSIHGAYTAGNESSLNMYVQGANANSDGISYSNLYVIANDSTPRYGIGLTAGGIGGKNLYMNQTGVAISDFALVNEPKQLAVGSNIKQPIGGYQNNWANYDGAGLTKIGPMVYLSGKVYKPSGNFIQNEVMFSIPAGYRSSNGESFSVIVSGNGGAALGTGALYYDNSTHQIKLYLGASANPVYFVSLVGCYWVATA